MPSVNDLGSDSPLYFSLLEHPCAHDLTRMTSPVVAFALWFRAQSRCPQKNDRPWVSVGTGTYTNPSTECRSAKCFPLASESLREWIQVRHSVRHLQLHPDRQLTNLTTHHCTILRRNRGVYFRDLTPSWLSPKSAECVVVEVQMLSTSRPHSTTTTVLCPAFICRTRRKECTSGPSLLACLFADNGASQIKGGTDDVSKQRSSKF
jgi:hypothetical protein